MAGFVWRTIEKTLMSLSQSAIRHCEWDAEKHPQMTLQEISQGEESMKKAMKKLFGILKWHPQGVWVRLWRGWHYDWQRPRSPSQAPPILYSSFNRQRLGLHRPRQARIPPAPCRGLEEHLKYVYSNWVKTPRWEKSLIPFFPLELNLASFLKFPPKKSWE